MFKNDLIIDFSLNLYEWDVSNVEDMSHLNIEI